MYFGGVPSAGKSIYLRRTEQISSADFIGCVKSLTVNGHERRLFSDSYNATGIRDKDSIISKPCTSQTQTVRSQRRTKSHPTSHPLS